jgi:selenide,water dikinase
VPQKRALALIGTGDRQAIASRGPFAAQGRSLGWLKDRIDRRWMRKYTELPFMAEESDVAGQGAMRCGGCAAKVPAEVLARAMARLAPAAKPEVSLGLERPDDAAVVSFPGAPPLLQTVDFFRAMVEDPYLFGRIAANHALGDIYAMGGAPETALAVATLPPSLPAVMEHDLFHMLKGGTEVLEETGAALIGGHSAEGAELGLGFAVTGRARPGRLLRKGGLRPDDRLVLTKPLGTGVILAAEMRGRAAARSFAAAVAAMRQSAAAAASSINAHCATASTDVTGFGLGGHLVEMLTASEMAARLDPAVIPVLHGARDLLASGLTSSLHGGNAAALAALAPADAASDPAFAALLLDPQTAGGLLAGVPAERAADCVAALIALGYRAATIGVVTAPDRGAPLVSLRAGCVSDADLAPLTAAGE